MPKRELFRTGDQALVRRINLSLLLHLLRTRGANSRAALAQATGLYKSTVSDLVAELLARQLVTELGMQSSGAGRPSTPLVINPRAGCIVSCELGVDYIAILVTDFAPEVIWQIREPILPGSEPTTVIATMVRLVRRAVDKGAAAGYALFGIAVGLPGIVEHATGTLVFAPNLGWRNVPLKALLEREAFDSPVFVDNEANMAALGEHYFGEGQGSEEVLYISAGAGLGGGMIRDGHLYRGARGGAAEFGHMTMVPDGEPCNCGNHGCWETLVSPQALFRTISRQAQGEATLLTAWTGGHLEQLTVPLVVEAARAGDAVALEALAQIGHWLGIGIASLLNALNPTRVVFGGVLSLAADILLPIVNQEIQWRALHWNRATVQVVRAAHGSDACVRGGVATVYQYVLAQPDQINERNGGEPR